MHFAGQAHLRSIAGRQPAHHIHIYQHLYISSFRLGSDYFQLFEYHTTGDVRYVFFHSYPDTDEWAIHSRKQHAAMDKAYHGYQPLEVFYGSNAPGVSQRKRIRRYVAAVFRFVGLRVGAQ